VLLLPTQLEQFLIMRRLVRFGAGLGIAPEVSNADYASRSRRLRKRGNTPRRRASSRSLCRPCKERGARHNDRAHRDGASAFTVTLHGDQAA